MSGLAADFGGGVRGDPRTPRPHPPSLAGRFAGHLLPWDGRRGPKKNPLAGEGVCVWFGGCWKVVGVRWWWEDRRQFGPRGAWGYPVCG